MSTFWLIIDPLRAPLAILAICGPFIWLFLGLVAARRRRRRGAAVSSALLSGAQSFGLGVAIAPIVLWFAVCAMPPGEGRLARQGKQRGYAVVAALDAYHRVSGRYPDSLSQLVPSFIAADRVARPTTARNSEPWNYRLDSAATFELTFHYAGPGQNRCSFTGAQRTWECSGYF